MTAPWVLVVDDDDDIRDALLIVLEMEGYTAFGAGDGVLALEEIRQRGRPCVILLDLRMPRMNGEELAAMLRRDPSLADSPIVVLSGDSNATEIATTMGAHGLLRKPIELAMLRQTMKQFVAR